MQESRSQIQDLRLRPGNICEAHSCRTKHEEESKEQAHLEKAQKLRLKWRVRLDQWWEESPEGA